MEPSSPATYRLEHWHDLHDIACVLGGTQTLDDLLVAVVRHAVVLRQRRATGLLVGVLQQPDSSYEVLRYSLGPAEMA
jgi:hypothetical protein